MMFLLAFGLVMTYRCKSTIQISLDCFPICNKFFRVGFKFAFLGFRVFEHVSQAEPVLGCLSRDIQSKLAPFGPAKS
jgi:hypothetical protein